jgi:holo-[acyl-carrier protein] synthase
MSQICLGTDIVYIPRIHSAMKQFGDRFLVRVYTLSEQQAFQKRQIAHHARQGWHPSIVYLAGRWAAKEAIVKAMGTGWRGIRYTDISIESQASGAPSVALIDKAATQGFLQGNWQLSLSHDGDYAIATALWWENQ